MWNCKLNMKLCRCSGWLVFLSFQTCAAANAWKMFAWEYLKLFIFAHDARLPSAHIKSSHLIFVHRTFHVAPLTPATRVLFSVVRAVNILYGVCCSRIHIYYAFMMYRNGSAYTLGCAFSVCCKSSGAKVCAWVRFGLVLSIILENTI